VAAFQEEKIRQYLMDELSEQEREEFEERLFVDDELVGEVQSAEMALIDRFVRNGMSRAERRGMEHNFLVTAERKAKAAEARMFHQELESLREPVIAEERVSWWSKLFSGWNLSLPQMQYATAGLVLVLTATIAWLAYDRGQTQNKLETAQAQTEIKIREQLAAKEKELNERLQQQRSDEADTLAALQQEIDQLQQQLAEAKRQQPELAKKLRSPDSTEPNVIETGRFPDVQVSNAGMPLIISVEEGTKVVKLQLPINDFTGTSFNATVTKETKVLLAVRNVKVRDQDGARILSISLAASRLEEGQYEVLLQNEKGETRKRVFLIQRQQKE
jgi:hypothetical protein